MMALSIDRLAEEEVGHWQLRVAQLEIIVRDLLLKNEQLRMALRAKEETDVTEAPFCGAH